MTEEKKPTERAREHLERGFGEMFKAAESVADAVKREVKKTGIPADLGLGGLGGAREGDASSPKGADDRAPFGRSGKRGRGGFGLGSLGLGNLGQAIDDAGREIVRAASNVATTVGTELETWGKRAQQSLDDAPADSASGGAAGADGPHRDPAASAAAGGDDWPKTREEYERKYGRDGDDWPRTREEYVEKYGRPPRPKDDDPGFRIATDDDDAKPR